MKQCKRIFACLLILVLLASNFATIVSAYEVNCGSNGCTSSRTYKVYHTWGTAVKIARHTVGKACNPLGTASNSYGKFTYTVKNSSGSVINSGTWNGDRNSSETLVGAWKSTGYYTVTISGVQFTSSAYSYWKSYPKYKITW